MKIVMASVATAFCCVNAPFAPPPTVAAFAPSTPARTTPSHRRTARLSDAVCDVPDLEVDSLVGVPNGAGAIKSAVLTNADGDFVRLDDVLARDKPNVVIYLRHMG